MPTRSVFGCDTSKARRCSHRVQFVVTRALHARISAASAGTRRSRTNIRFEQLDRSGRTFAAWVAESKAVGSTKIAPSYRATAIELEDLACAVENRDAPFERRQRLPREIS